MLFLFTPGKFVVCFEFPNVSWTPKIVGTSEIIHQRRYHQNLKNLKKLGNLKKISLAVFVIAQLRDKYFICLCFIANMFTSRVLANKLPAIFLKNCV